MIKEVEIKANGGPEKILWKDCELEELKPGQVTLEHTFVGLNFIDTYHRSGLYPLPLPTKLGMEGAGVVTNVGPGVTSLSLGDRVAYASPPPGSYAEERNINANAVVKIPDSISDKVAAALMLKGLTAQYLIRQIHKVGPSDTILIHAAAGGVGLIVCQWAKKLGATVIGTVGNDEKAALAKDNGCDYPIVYTRENFVDRVLEITNGNKLPVVYDSVGKDTFEQSLDCLQPLGKMVSFGQSSGSISPVDLGVFAQKGSLSFTRPTLFHYASNKERLDALARDLFDVVASGDVKIRIDQEFPLKEAKRAHDMLEARSTTASTILLP